MTRSTRSVTGSTTASPPATIPEPSVESIDAAVTRANQEGRTVFLTGTGTVPAGDPLDWLAAQTRLPRVYWHTPNGVELAGAGDACTIEPSLGTPAFSAADQAAGILAERTIRAGRSEESPERFLGGFAFEPEEQADADWETGGFARARLVLPEALLVRRGSEHRLVFSLQVEPGSTRASIAADRRRLAETYAVGSERQTARAGVLTPSVSPDDRDTWTAAVRTVLDRIGTGTLHKVVLARRSRFTMSTAGDMCALVSALREADTSCTHFAFQWTAEAAFVGATPERLFRRDGPILRADCMAGTTRRGVNGDTDHTLADALLASTKDRLEHSYVVEAVLHDMAKLCSRLDTVPEPRIVQLATLQHLSCPITGRLRDGITVGDILRQLHPTPAVGGWPRADALTLISDLETHSRGWYAGPVGWIGTEDAEFAVAIRSALVRNTAAIIYAGAGIVAGSDSEREWQETDDKLQAFVRAVNAQATHLR